MSLQTIATLVEQRIQEAQRAGAFDHLGSGPIRELQRDYREGWWLRRLMEREQLHEVTRAPSSTDIRTRIDALMAAGDEDAVRAGVDQLNEDLQRRAEILNHRLPRIDPEAIISRWQRQHRPPPAERTPPPRA